MQPRYLLYSILASFILILIILLFGVSFLIPASPAYAQAIVPIDTPTATPDVNQILKETIDAKNSAQDSAQSVFGVVNVLIPIAGIVFALVSGAFAFYGFNTRQGIKEAQENYLKSFKEIQDKYTSELETVKDLRTQIEHLQTEFEHTKMAFASLRLGDILFADGKREMAIEAYKDAKKLLPSNSLINYSLGRAYNRTKQYNAAIELLEEAFNDKPDSPETCKELGLAYRLRGEERYQADPQNIDQYRSDYLLAIKYLERAIRLNPKYEDALGPLGGLYKRLGNYQVSLDYYLRATNADRNSSYALGNIASIQWHEGNFDLARETFKQTEEIASRRIERKGEGLYWDFYDRALARLVLRGKQAALADYNIAIGLTPGEVELESVLNNLQFLQSAKNPQESIDGLDEVIEMIDKQIAMKRSSR